MELLSILIASGALIVSAVTFVLGRLDRREARRSLERQQAGRVTVIARPVWEPTGGGNDERVLSHWSVAVRNRSDLPIEIQSVRYVWLPFWYDIVEGGDRHGAYTEESKSANATVLEPDDTWTEERNVYGEGNADGSGGPDPDFVWLTFCDHSNTIWEVRNDSKELRREGWREIRWWQWGFEKLTRRLPFIDRFVVVPWARFAGWSARRHGPNHMPLSMRTLRWLRGGWVHGEPEVKSTVVVDEGATA